MGIDLDVSSDRQTWRLELLRAQTRPFRGRLLALWGEIALLAMAVRRSVPIDPKRKRDVEVLVASSGGVATTCLLHYLSQFVETNCPDDEDDLKHWPRPIGWARKSIFVHGEAEKVFASIERRGWVREQGAKLGSLLTLISTGTKQKAAFCAAVKRQQQAWDAAAMPVLHLTYDDLWDRVEEIAQFADISDPGFVLNFPPRRERESLAAPQPQLLS